MHDLKMKSLNVKNMSSGQEWTMSSHTMMTIAELKDNILKKLSSVGENIREWEFFQIYINQEIATGEKNVHELYLRSKESKSDGIFYIISAPNRFVDIQNDHYNFCMDEEEDDDDDDFDSRFEYTLDEKNIVFDRASLTAAVNWYIEYKENHQNTKKNLLTADSSYDEKEDNVNDNDDEIEEFQRQEEIAEVLNDFLQYEDLGLLCYGEEKKPVPANGAQQPRENNNNNNIQFFNMNAFFSVLARVVIAYMWFGRGGVSSFPIWKIVVILGGLIFGYLFEIGLIAYLLRQVNSAQLSYLVQGLNPLPNETIYETITRHLQNAAAIPTQQHFIYDIYAIIMSFPLSLMPSWQPKPALAAELVPPAVIVTPPVVGVPAAEGGPAVNEVVAQQ